VNGKFKALGDVAVAVLRGLGCPAVIAPGEAEATCAALNAAGAVVGWCKLKRVETRVESARSEHLIYFLSNIHQAPRRFTW